MDREPKTRQENGKGKGKKYKDMYSRKHIDAMVDKTKASIVKSQKKSSNGK
jgi:hypothetical protein